MVSDVLPQLGLTAFDLGNRSSDGVRIGTIFPAPPLDFQRKITNLRFF